MLCFRSTPVEPPSTLDVPPQERATWSSLRIELDGECLTRRKERPEQDEVIGPLSGIAEWVVECWPSILFEVHTPFDKLSVLARGAKDLPSLRSACEFWTDSGALDIGRMGAWQHRHTLGHASTDVAIPPLVFLPDVEDVGISVDELATALSPNVKFELPASHRTELKWMSVEVLADILASFVRTVAERARRVSDARPWGDWILSELAEAQRGGADPAERRKWRLGEGAGRSWPTIEASYATISEGLEGVLTDSRELRSESDLKQLAECLRPRSRTRHAGAWSRVAIHGVRPRRVAYEQGYALAHAVREATSRSRGPLDIQELLKALEVTLVVSKRSEVFRSATLHDTQGRAVIAYAATYFEDAGLAPRNFAIAAALGRLLSEQRLAEGRSAGAAHGTQSRWRATQVANAFAAELHAPIEDVRQVQRAEDLVERFGLSMSASIEHFANRRREDAWVPGA
ncbi:MAG: hypothetical protein IPN34_19210 [Planctomycetes bacterium]|nr:hypothetical protein [Planctomycetota bacterium]